VQKAITKAREDFNETKSKETAKSSTDTTTGEGAKTDGEEGAKKSKSKKGGKKGKKRKNRS